MKLLIVDDEELIRLKLRHIAENSTIKFNSIETASNAFQALESIKREAPAVILSDIQMPRKNGLDIAKYIFESGLPSKVILVTGYSDFQYAKAGIQYHVFDYLLKPIDEENTLRVLQNAASRYQDEQRRSEMFRSFQNYYVSHQSEVRQQVIQRILFHPLSMDGERLIREEALLNFPFNNYQLIGCRYHSAAAKIPLKTELFISYALKKSFSSICGEESLFCDHGNTLFAIVANTRQDNYGTLYENLEQCVQSFAKQYCLDIRLGVSRQAESVEDLVSLREEVSICLNYMPLHPGTAVFFDDLPISYGKMLTVNDEIRSILASLQTLSADDFQENCRHFLSFIYKFDVNFRQRSIRLLIYNLSICLSDLAGNSPQLSEINDLLADQMEHSESLNRNKEEAFAWLNNLYHIFSQMREQQNHTLIHTIQHYIYQNFDKPIGLPEIGAYINRNPSYVSRLIKQETGENLTQILSKLRIKKAKHLLKTTNIKISEVAAAVGYSSQQYFNRIFTEQTGMSPTDFRKITQTFS